MGTTNLLKLQLRDSKNFKDGISVKMQVFGAGNVKLQVFCRSTTELVKFGGGTIQVALFSDGSIVLTLSDGGIIQWSTHDYCSIPYAYSKGQCKEIWFHRFCLISSWIVNLALSKAHSVKCPSNREILFSYSTNRALPFVRTTYSWLGVTTAVLQYDKIVIVDNLVIESKMSSVLIFPVLVRCIEPNVWLVFWHMTSNRICHK